MSGCKIDQVWGPETEQRCGGLTTRPAGAFFGGAAEQVNRSSLSSTPSLALARGQVPAGSHGPRPQPRRRRPTPLLGMLALMVAASSRAASAFNLDTRFWW